MAQLFPMFVKLAGKKCLLVGAGEIAEQKVEGLLLAEADVHVVAPQAGEHIRQLAADSTLRWSQRKFEAGDLIGVALVIAATADPQVNAEVFRTAEANGVLCNAVDDPEHCHFYYPAVVRRGDLQIAISTNGNSPALAQRLRAELEEQFPREYESWLRWLGQVRTLLFRRSRNPQQRKRVLHRIASREVYERFASAKRRQGERANG